MLIIYLFSHTQLSHTHSKDFIKGIQIVGSQWVRGFLARLTKVGMWYISQGTGASMMRMRMAPDSTQQQ